MRNIWTGGYEIEKVGDVRDVLGGRRLFDSKSTVIVPSQLRELFFSEFLN
jgi:hypothetical protein